MSTVESYAAYFRDQVYDFANNLYSLEMTQQAIEFSKQLAQTASNVIEAGTRLSVIAGEKVEQITNDTLPPKLAYVFQRVFNGSGMALANLCLPGPVVNVGLAIFFLAPLFANVSPQTLRNGYDGLALVSLYQAACDLASFLVTGDPNSLISAVVNVIVAVAFAFFTGPDVPSKVPVGGEPEEIPLQRSSNAQSNNNNSAFPNINSIPLQQNPSEPLYPQLENPGDRV